MSDDRPTVRPVTLARLVELTHICTSDPTTTDEIETTLDVTHRRARETILEAARIDLIEIIEPEAEHSKYKTTDVGETFLEAVRDERWSTVSDILETRSPPLSCVPRHSSKGPPDITRRAFLEELKAASNFSSYKFNQTSVEVVGDWAERLGRIHRNAFSGTYYPVTRSDVPTNFQFILLTAFDELESSTGSISDSGISRFRNSARPFVSVLGVPVRRSTTPLSTLSDRILSNSSYPVHLSTRARKKPASGSKR